jgi:hypothetical protein
MAKKPLARLGVTIHSTVGKFPDGFYWFATEDHQTFRRVIQCDPDAIDAQEWHGPFDTREEAARAAEIGIIGERCEIKRGGTWDPALERPH